MSESVTKESGALGLDDDAPEQFALVDITTLEGIVFVKRAPLENIHLWGIVLGMEGRQTKRLDLITDLEQLQYLFWNTSQQPPSDTFDIVKAECAKLATNVAVDLTSVEALRSQIPTELLNSIGASQKGDTKLATENGPIEKPGAKGKGKGKKVAAAAGTEGDGAAAPAEAKVAKVKDPTGRPGEGTSTRKVWDIADSLVLQSGNNTTPTRKAVIDAAVAAGVNKATAGVQYGAWMKGLNRAPAPEPPKPAAPAEAAAGATEAAK